MVGSDAPRPCPLAPNRSRTPPLVASATNGTRSDRPFPMPSTPPGEARERETHLTTRSTRLMPDEARPRAFPATNQPSLC